MSTPHYMTHRPSVKPSHKMDGGEFFVAWCGCGYHGSPTTWHQAVKDGEQHATAKNQALYDVAAQVTDEVLGPGTYEAMNKGNSDPGVLRAIASIKESYRRRSEMIQPPPPAEET